MTKIVLIKDVLGDQFLDFQEFCAEKWKLFIGDLNPSDFEEFCSSYGVSYDYITTIQSKLQNSLLTPSAPTRPQKSSISTSAFSTGLSTKAFEKLLSQQDIPLHKLFDVDYPEEYKEISIKSIDFCNRFLNKLWEKQVEDIYSLICFTISDIVQWGGIGDKTIRQSIALMYKYFKDPNSLKIKLSSNHRLSPAEIVNIRVLINQALNNEDVCLDALSDQGLKMYHRLMRGISLCGQELYFASQEDGQYFLVLAELLRDFYRDSSKYVTIEDKLNCYQNYCNISATLLDKSAKAFLASFSKKHQGKLMAFCNSIDSNLLVKNLWGEFVKFEASLREDWVAFGDFCSWLTNLDIASICQDIFVKDAFVGINKSDDKFKDKYWVAIKKRAGGSTLEEMGNLVGITRERARQIEKKYICNVVRRYNRSDYDLVEIIYALRGGDAILTYDEIGAFIEEQYLDLLWLVLSKGELESESYQYSREYNAVLTKVHLTSEKQNMSRALEHVPDFFFKRDLDAIINSLVKEYGVYPELIMAELLENYRLYGELYSKEYLTVGFMCSYVLKEKFFGGYKIADKDESDRFQAYLQHYFGSKGQMTSRAIDATVAEVGILCDRGKYLHPTFVTVEQPILDKINQFIESSPKAVLTYSEIFEACKSFLEGTSIVNKYFLQGVMKHSGCKYDMARDYISKQKGRGLNEEFEEFAKKLGIFHKNEFLVAFPSLNTSNLGMIVGRSPTVFSIDNGMYMHSSLLDIHDDDFVHISNYLDDVCAVNPVSSRFLYNEFLYKFSDFVERNDINNHTKLYGILFFMFSEKYFFSRPYISKERGEWTNKSVILRYFDSANTIGIDEAIALCVDNEIRYFSSGALIKTVSPEYVRIDENTLMRKELTGINDDIVLEVVTQVMERLETIGYCASSTFTDFLFFPSINLTWNAYLLESVVSLATTAVNVIVIPSTNYLTLSHIFVDEKYADDDYQSFILRLVDEAYDRGFFTTKMEMKEWLHDNGLISGNSLPYFLEDEQYYFSDKNGLLKKK